MTTTEPTTIEKIAGLRWTLLMNAANQVFCQLIYFGSVFVLFLDHLGLSKASIGFVLSLTPFANVLALVVAPYAARFGYKRIFVIFYGLRKTVTILLLLTPWIVSTYGGGAAFYFVTAVVALFSIFRAIEETGYIPWYQEFVPKTMLGKFSALSNILMALIGILSVSTASFVLARTTGLTGFMGLIAAGIVVGYVSVWSSTFIPGGAPIANAEEKPRDLGIALRDRDFMRYMFAITLVTFATGPIASFLPLFLQEQVGLSSSVAVLVQVGTMVGTVLSSYLWGWAADRYGSRPVTLAGIWLLAIMPILWWLLPHNSHWSLSLAIAFAFVQGLANLSWGIGATRMLFATIVPPDKNADYFALYFAWAGIAAGISSWAGGWLLDLLRSLSGQFWGITLDAYVLLFLISVALMIWTAFLVSPIRTDSKVSLTEFAGLFVRGNAISALGSLISFRRATEEHDVILMTERLGQAKSLLTVDELLEALDDPRFNVRFEAIISIARMPPEPRLIEALVKILEGYTPALSAIAAWALGRMGDERALPALRQGMHSRYRSIQAHCARSLASLEDHEAAPMMHERFEIEEDEGVKVALASALGMLKDEAGIDTILSLLQRSQDEHVRMELALSLARIAGEESDFIQLWRAVRDEPAIALAQAMGNVKKKIENLRTPEPELLAQIDQCTESFAREAMPEGIHHLHEILAHWSPSTETPMLAKLRQEYAQRLGDYDPTRVEYPLLAVHWLQAV